MGLNLNININGAKKGLATPPIPTLGTPIVISDTQINIPVTSSYPYEMWYCLTELGTYTKHGNGTATPYAMTGLTFETEYWVKTRAKNGSKYSEFTPAKSQYSSLWAYKIVTDHKFINNHIPSDYYDEYYKPIIYNVLKSTYEDSEGVGYYYNTFGPDGFNNEAANFFILFFIWSNLTADTSKAINPSTSIRLNIEGTIYNQNTIPNHTYNNNEYFIITNNNNLSNINQIKLGTTKLYRYIPSFKYCKTTYIILWLDGQRGSNIYNFIGDMSNYVQHQPIFGALQIQTNSLSGVCPDLDSALLSVYRVNDNYFTSINIENWVIHVGITEIRIDYNYIYGSYLLQLVEKLNDFYSTILPTNNLILNMGGTNMGIIEGDIVENVWQENAAIVELRSYFTTASKTLTLTYNSDELSFGETIGILTYDDGALNDYEQTLPLLNKYNICATFYISGSKINTENYMSWEQVQEMIEYGNDIQCHTYEHRNLTLLTEQQIRDEMTNNNSSFVANNVEAPISTAYPLYINNETVRNIVAEYRSICRAGGGLIGNPSFVYKDGDKKRLNAVSADVKTIENVESVKYAVLGAYNRKAVIIFSLHSLTPTYGVDADLFDDVLDYAINEKGLSFMTMKEFYTIYGDDFL